MLWHDVNIHRSYRDIRFLIIEVIIWNALPFSISRYFIVVWVLIRIIEVIACSIERLEVAIVILIAIFF